MSFDPNNNDHFKKMDKLIGEIKDKHGKTNANGTIECPFCEGTIYYRVVAYNGHTAGSCSTEDCFNWME